MWGRSGWCISDWTLSGLELALFVVWPPVTWGELTFKSFNPELFSLVGSLNIIFWLLCKFWSEGDISSSVVVAEFRCFSVSVGDCKSSRVSVFANNSTEVGDSSSIWAVCSVKLSVSVSDAFML